MKKLSITIMAAMLLSLTVHAQYNSFGLRTEYSGGFLRGGLAYQHAFGEKWLMEFDAMATFKTSSLDLALVGLAQYRMHLVGNLYGVLGVGAEVGYVDVAHKMKGLDNNIALSAVGQAGLTYMFDKIPIDLTIDFRPRLNIVPNGCAPVVPGGGLSIALRPPKPHKPDPQYQRTEYTLVAYYSSNPTE